MLHLRPLPNGVLSLPPATEKLLHVLLPNVGKTVPVGQLRALFKGDKVSFNRWLHVSRPHLEKLGFWVARMNGGYRLMRTEQ